MRTLSLMERLWLESAWQSPSLSSCRCQRSKSYLTLPYPLAEPFSFLVVPLPEKPSIGLGATSSSAYGAFFHDQSTFKTQKDDNMALLRATNGIRRLLPEEENSQFALEDLPVADRIL